MKNKEDLAAPYIKEVGTGGLVSLEILNRGFTVIVPHSDALEGSFMLIAYFLDEDGFEKYETLMIDGETGDVEVFFTKDKLAQLHGEKVKLLYRLFPSNDDSAIANFDFDADIYRPQIKEIIDHQLPWPELDQGIDVHIRPYKQMKAGDQIRLFMAGSFPRSSELIEIPVTEEDVGKTLTARIPAEKSRLTAGAETTIFYELERSGIKTISYSKSFQSALPVPELIPKEILWPAMSVPMTMSRIDESGKYPFTIQFASPPVAGEKVTVLVVDSRNWICKIFEHTIEVPETLVTILMPVEMFYSSQTFETVVLIKSNENWVSSPRTQVNFAGTSELRRQKLSPTQPIVLTALKP